MLASKQLCLLCYFDSCVRLRSEVSYALYDCFKLQLSFCVIVKMILAWKDVRSTRAACYVRSSSSA